MDRARARHLLPCSPVGPKLSLAMREGHLHQLQLWALFHSLLAAHGPANKATAGLAAVEKPLDAALPEHASVCPCMYLQY